MLARRSSYCAFFVLAITLAIPAFAQFQQPTDEELKMTVDPKAPGAAAVFLNVEEIANDPLHYQSYYARIKVLGEKGKDLATVEIPYLRGNFKITAIKGRTIHSDGTVIPLAVKPEDLLISKNGDREIGRKVFTLPSVEVGSILEYRYQLDYDDNIYSSPDWEIQQKYFVHKARYQFTPQLNFQPSNKSTSSTYLTDSRGRMVHSLLLWANLPDGVKVKSDVGGHYTLDLADIPAIPDEDYMPPIKNFLYRAFFYYMSDSSAREFWSNEAKGWSKEVDRFAEQSNTIHEAAAGLLAPGDTELVKAQKIYEAVQALENTDYTRKKGASELKALNLKEAKHAEDTWKQKSGDSEDIALLYLALVRAVGLKAYAMKVVARDRGIFDMSYMSMGQLDDTVILLTADGKEYILDPGEKMAPFATVNWRHSGASGVRQTEQGTGFLLTPQQQSVSNVTTRTGEITLDAKGAVTGAVVVAMTGQEALRWRQRMLWYDSEEVNKQFEDELKTLVPEGVEVHVDHFQGAHDPKSNLMAVANLKGTLGIATPKRLLLPGFFFIARQHVPFIAQEKRLEPVDMRYPARESEEMTYYVPAGMIVEGIPRNTDIPWEGHAVYETSTDLSSTQVHVVRSEARVFTQAKPEEYQALRDFYQKVAASDQQQLVLAVAPAAQGN